MGGTNERMFAVWDGAVGRRWVDQERYERMNEPFGTALMSAAHIEPGHDVLDVGCGHGARTIDAARATGTQGSVLGVDISGPMLEAAAARAADLDLTHVSFRKADAQTDDLGSEMYDVIISQFGIMFFSDPEAAFTNLRKALRPGGHIAFACWQSLDRQERLMVPLSAALEHIPVPDYNADDWSPAAFSMADPADIQTTLTAAGFDHIDIQPIVAAQYQGADVSDTVSFLQTSEFAESVFAKADTAESLAGWSAVTSALAPYLTPEGVYLDGAAWSTTATRP